MDQDLWQNVLDKLEERIVKSSFQTWFNDTTLIEITNETLFIKVTSKFKAEYLNNNYSEMISEISYELYKKKYKIAFTEYQTTGERDPSAEKWAEIIKLNVKYTFENFVVGKSNNFAHSAALAVAETPGTIYNPLFLHGESGMGKTHLMQAIGHYTRNNFKNFNVYYITTEQFTNEMIESIRNNTMRQFRNKFRNIDLLLVDDIHFLSKKEGSQEEFFHTFNTLYENKKQIVITSDIHPKDIPDLENRLVTRFEWGLLADLKNPDFETRVAILKKKAQFENIQLSDEILRFIADRVSTNVRALEGSLIRILAYSSLNKINLESITIETIQDILSDMIIEIVSDLTMDNILSHVCKHYGLTPKQLLERNRKRDIAFPRQVGMYLSNLMIPHISLKEIATYYGRKDHTTVIHAIKMIEKKYREDNNFRIQIDSLIKGIKGIS